MRAMERARWLREKQDEIRLLHDLRLSEVTPSRRDFGMYIATQRQELAVIARVQSSNESENLAFAVACDDAEVAAIAVPTDTARHGSLATLRSIAERTQAPILRDDLTLHPSQLYAARLHGADAALLPAAELEQAALADLMRVAASLHMACVVEVQSPADLAKSLSLSKAVIGLNTDIVTMLRLARDIPANRTVVALREPDDTAAARALHGHVDAVVLGALLRDSDDLAASLAALNQ